MEQQKQKLQEKIKKFVLQTQNGCGQPVCFNEFCGNNPDRKKMEKTLALQRALSLIKVNNFKLCEDQGNITNFATFEALNGIETKNTEFIISEYSRYLARSDVMGFCFSKDGQTYLGEIDCEIVEKISSFIYNMDSQLRNDFLGNLNTYMVLLELICRISKFLGQKN